MTTLLIKPNPNCLHCHGTGTVYDTVDYGSTTAQLPSMCGCVEEQVPDGDDRQIEIDYQEPEPVNVEYSDFIECQYCNRWFDPGDTAAMQDHWRKCPNHPARAEIDRLRRANEELRREKITQNRAMLAVVDDLRSENITLTARCNDLLTAYKAILEARIARRTSPNGWTYYECQWCKKTAVPGDEIQHTDACDVWQPLQQAIAKAEQEA